MIGAPVLYCISRPGSAGGKKALGTSKNRFEKGKWVECAECDESLLVRLYALRGGFLKQSVCYTHFLSNKVFRGDHKLYGGFCDVTRLYFGKALHVGLFQMERL